MTEKISEELSNEVTCAILSALSPVLGTDIPLLLLKTKSTIAIRLGMSTENSLRIDLTVLVKRNT